MAELDDEDLRREVDALRQRVEELELERDEIAESHQREKDEMIDSFQTTTSVLLERIKVLEREKQESAKRSVGATGADEDATFGKERDGLYSAGSTRPGTSSVWTPGGGGGVDPVGVVRGGGSVSDVGLSGSRELAVATVGKMEDLATASPVPTASSEASSSCLSSARGGPSSARGAVDLASQRGSLRARRRGGVPGAGPPTTAASTAAVVGAGAGAAAEAGGGSSSSSSSSRASLPTASPTGSSDGGGGPAGGRKRRG